MKNNILLVVVVALVTAESATLERHKRRARNSCRYVERAATSCAVMVPARLQDDAVWRNYTTPKLNIPINQLCGELQGLRNCFAAKAAVCSGHDKTATILNYVVANFDYICSAEGKATVTEMMSSPCNSQNGDVARAVITEMNLCESVSGGIFGGSSRRRSDSERCSSVNELMDCGIEVMTRTCGSAAGSIAENTWEIAQSFPKLFKYLYGFECSADDDDDEVDDLADRLFSRAVAFFK